MRSATTARNDHEMRLLDRIPDRRNGPTRSRAKTRPMKAYRNKGEEIHTNPIPERASTKLRLCFKRGMHLNKSDGKSRLRDKRGAKKDLVKRKNKNEKHNVKAKQKARKNRQPGSLVGGEPEIYHYYWIPNHEPQYTTMMVKLTDLGYELEPDKEVHFHGVLGGTVLRVPVEVREHMREERAKKHGHSLKRR